MKFAKKQHISFKVILLFTLAIFSTFISDQLHDFFGDFKCQGTGKFLKDSYTYDGCNYSARSVHDPTFHWGYRHWLYFAMCNILFIIQAVDIINFACTSEREQQK